MITIEQKHKIRKRKSHKIRIRYFAACRAFIFILEKESQQFTYLKQQKNENKSGREMCHKIIHRSERFWQEIMFVLIYFFLHKNNS